MNNIFRELLFHYNNYLERKITFEDFTSKRISIINNRMGAFLEELQSEFIAGKVDRTDLNLLMNIIKGNVVNNTNHDAIENSDDNVVINNNFIDVTKRLEKLEKGSVKPSKIQMAGLGLKSVYNYLIVALVWSFGYTIIYSSPKLFIKYNTENGIQYPENINELLKFRENLNTINTLFESIIIILILFGIKNTYKSLMESVYEDSDSEENEATATNARYNRIVLIITVIMVIIGIIYALYSAKTNNTIS